MAAAVRALDQLHVVQPERQQYGFFKPLMDGPAGFGLFGDARLAIVEQAERGFDRVAQFAAGLAIDALAPIPALFDRRLELPRFHAASPNDASHGATAAIS